MVIPHKASHCPVGAIPVTRVSEQRCPCLYGSIYATFTWTQMFQLYRAGLRTKNAFVRKHGIDASWASKPEKQTCILLWNCKYQVCCCMDSIRLCCWATEKAWNAVPSFHFITKVWRSCVQVVLLLTLQTLHQSKTRPWGLVKMDKPIKNYLIFCKVAIELWDEKSNPSLWWWHRTPSPLVCQHYWRK